VNGPDCEPEGRGTMLHCDEKSRGCRVCDKCRFGVGGTAVLLVREGKALHDCCMSADERDKCMAEGHEVLVLPDLGVGKKTFEDVHQQAWGGAQGCWSIREAEHVDRLRDLWSKTDDMKGDPREVVRKVYTLMEEEQKNQRTKRKREQKVIVSV
jgi:hypothetical protein